MQTLRVLVLILLTVPAMAQIEPRLFEFGPTAGLNLSRVSPVDTFTYDQKSKFGLKGGIFTRFNYGKFSLQPEFIYQAKGSNLSKPVNGTHTYRYLSTPILLGYSPLKHIYIEAGYERSWALNKMNETPLAGKSFGPGQGKDQSLIFGARVNLLDMFSLLSINIRYVHGLDNVTDLKVNNLPLNFQNRSFQIGVSYTFSEQYLWNKKFGTKKKKN
jgi:hypothetical protein